MKLLTKVSKRIWFFCFLLIVCSGFFTYYVLNYKIEAILIAQVKVSNFNKTELKINDQAVYKLQDRRTILLHVNRKKYLLKIKNIFYSEKENSYILTLEKNNLNLLKNTTLKATIIYESKSIKSIIFEKND